MPAGSAAFRGFLPEHFAFFYDAYQCGIHENFALIDLLFVAVFVLELVNQIEVAIKTIVGNVVDQLLEDSKGIDVRRFSAQAEHTITLAFAEQHTAGEGVGQEPIPT